MNEETVGITPKWQREIGNLPTHPRAVSPCCDRDYPHRHVIERYASGGQLSWVEAVSQEPVER